MLMPGPADRSGRQDMAMLHGGCPVLLGRKLVANKWVREVANMFSRPCGLSPHSGDTPSQGF